MISIFYRIAMKSLRELLNGGLPSAEKITQYRQLPNLVDSLKGKHSSALQGALEKHPELSQAWTVIQDSAHPDSTTPLNSDLCHARRLMVADLISATKTGDLVNVDA